MTQHRSTYIYHGSVLVSQILVCHQDSRAPRRIKVAHMRQDHTRQRREWRYNLNVTVILPLSPRHFVEIEILTSRPRAE